MLLSIGNEDVIMTTKKRPPRKIPDGADTIPYSVFCKISYKLRNLRRFQVFTGCNELFIRNENVTPSGSPTLVNPMNNGIDAQEQNGVTVPSKAAIQYAPIP